MLTLTITANTFEELKEKVLKAFEVSPPLIHAATSITAQQSVATDTPTTTTPVEEVKAKRGRKPKQEAETIEAVAEIAEPIDANENTELTVEDCKNAMRSLIEEKGIPTASAVLEPFKVKAARFLAPEQFSAFIKAANEARGA